MIFIAGTLLTIFLLIIVNYISSISRQKHLCNDDDYKVSYCNIGTLKIAYKICGEGPPLLMIHGFMASQIIFQPIADTLKNNFTLYLIDVIGYGMSDKNPCNDYSKKSMADMAINFMKKNGIDRFSIMGHSMGGEVSLYICSFYPAMVDKLVLVDSAGMIKARITNGFLGRNKLLFFLFIKYIFNTYEFQRFFYRFQIYNKDKADINLFNRVFCDNMQIPMNTMYNIFHAADTFDIKEKLSEIKISALIIWGKNDNIIPLKIGIEISRSIKNSQFVIIDRCGHCPYLEYPDKFVSLVSSFLYDKNE